MFKNDAKYWEPSNLPEAISLSWTPSDGEYNKLFEHNARTLDRINKAIPGIFKGKLIEFGAGLGMLDDLLPPTVTELVLMDHTHKFIGLRKTPLSERCRFVPLSDIGSLSDVYFDIAISVRVFYHVDTLTAIAIIKELGRMVRQDGHIIIQGFYKNDMVKHFIDKNDRLTTDNPNYIIDTELVKTTLLSYGYDCRHVDGDILVVRRLVRCE